MALLHLFGGLVGLVLGAELAVRGALGVAHGLRWPNWVAGLFLLALGTSLPELFLTIASAPSHPGLAAGNLFGSNACNVGLVLGAALLLKGTRSLDAHSVSLGVLLPMAVASGLAFWAFHRELPLVGVGLLFLAGYGVMVFSAAREERMAPHPTPGEVMPPSPRPLGLSAVTALGGFVLLALASDWFVDGALGLAASFGWHEGFAGYLIAALGTSSPELFTTVRAVRSHASDVVFGNVAGSNAFNLLLAGGVLLVLGRGPLDAFGLPAQLWANLAATLVLLTPALARPVRRSLEVHHSRLLGAALIVGWVLSLLWVHRG